MAVFVQTMRRLARRGAVVAGVEAKQTAVNHSVNSLLRPVSVLLYNHLKEEHQRHIELRPIYSCQHRFIQVAMMEVCFF